MQRSSTSRRQLPSSRAALVRIGALAAILAVASFAAYKLGWFDYTHTLEHVARLRTSHSVVTFTIGFMIVYGLGTSVGMPGLPFTVAAGVLYGTLLGTALSWAGSMLSAALGYWIACTVGRDVVIRWMKRFKRADAAVEESRDFAGMLRLRLIPVLPLGTVNFVGGLAKAPFSSYLAATGLGIIPATAIYCYFADSLLEGVGHRRGEAIKSLVIASVLLIVLSLAPRWLNRAKRAPASTMPGPDFAGDEPSNTAKPPFVSRA